MIDFTLNEDQRLIQNTAREFAEGEVRPIVDRIQRAADPHGDHWALLEPMYRKAAELGFTTFYIPEAFGGAGRSPMDGAIFIEEIAAVDIGVAMTLGATMGYPLFILFAGTDAQRQKFLPALSDGKLHILAGAQSEPNVAGSEMFCPSADPKLGMRTHARRDGDQYVLNGAKSGFVTNAGIADHYFIVARTALDQPQAQSLSLFYVPAGAPGFHVGARTRMLGMATGYHAELRLENVRVPADQLIGAEGGALAILSAVLGQGLGAPFVGLARAAYHYALAYAKERRSWGRPLIEHQAIALMLAQMEIDVQSARLLTWDSVAAAMRMDPATGVKAMAAKTHAVDVAIKTATNAVKILGGYGVTREYQAAKYLCDAMMGYALDFTGDLLRIRMAERL